MLSTIVLAAVLLAVLVASVALWALFLRVGLRWAQATDVTTRRIILAMVAVVILQVAVDALFLMLPFSADEPSLFLSLVQVVACVLAACLVISAVFKIRLLRAFQAWLPTLLASIVMVAAVLLVVRPFLYESFYVPENAMAPTLLGDHWRAACPECDKPCFCSPINERDVRREPPLMICDNFHVTQPAILDRAIHPGVRFLVAKFYAPRRWDIVVFQVPEDPETLYVMRLVGLPGETIHIEGGAIWIDGKKQTPPESIRGIQYVAEMPGGHGPEGWGSVDRPAVLGDDEYFVLGDFSAQSYDSRFWSQGAARRSTYAVPESHIKGVVTHTFWPPSRWRIHR